MKAGKFCWNFSDVVGGQSCRYLAFLKESIFALVTEWILSKDMVKLYELSSTVYAVLQEWLDDQMLDSLGDQTWIDMSEEWT